MKVTEWQDGKIRNFYIWSTLCIYVFVAWHWPTFGILRVWQHFQVTENGAFFLYSDWLLYDKLVDVCCCCCVLQHMTVSDVISEATKRLGIDTSQWLVSTVLLIQSLWPVDTAADWLLQNTGIICTLLNSVVWSQESVSPGVWVLTQSQSHTISQSRSLILGWESELESRFLEPESPESLIF